jgi:hypothetical protein
MNTLSTSINMVLCDKNIMKLCDKNIMKMESDC